MQKKNLAVYFTLNIQQNYEEKKKKKQKKIRKKFNKKSLGKVQIIKQNLEIHQYQKGQANVLDL